MRDKSLWTLYFKVNNGKSADIRARKQVKTVANRKRRIQLHFMVNEQEREFIREKMAAGGILNLGAYLRKMAVDGYMIFLDLKDVRELISMLRRHTNILNQIAKRVNSTGRIYEDELKEIQEQQEKLWDAMNDILISLSKVKR